MPSNDNTVRARRARTILARYAEQTDPHADLDTLTVDLLADLLHLRRSDPTSFAKFGADDAPSDDVEDWIHDALRRAIDHYTYEQEHGDA